VKSHDWTAVTGPSKSKGSRPDSELVQTASTPKARVRAGLNRMPVLSVLEVES
jgi:hypothetical protein